MGRPHKERRIEKLPPVTHYKPAGIPLRELEEVTLNMEEMEAIRLADIEELDQATAADRMEVSRPTFHRIISTAHRKIAAALWAGHALRVDGGNYRIAHQCQTGFRRFICRTCGHKWDLPRGNGQRCHDLACPNCHAVNASRCDD
jgi:predicted DNA-binding protein (UPF0251 family)